jgi:hypothetical protein
LRISRDIIGIKSINSRHFLRDIFLTIDPWE